MQNASLLYRTTSSFRRWLCDPSTHKLFPPTGPPESLVTFKSSDGVLLHLQRRCLETGAGAFPGPEIQTNGELVDLTETAEILAILFQFIPPREYPHLEQTPFKCLMSVGEAAEKYEVHAAVNITALRIESLLNSESPCLSDEECIAILNHAVKHHHPILIDKAARQTARCNVAFMMSRLIPQVIPAWTQYRARWDSIFTAASLNLSSKRLFRARWFCNPQAVDMDGEDAPRICSSCFSLVDSWISHLSKLESYTSLKSQVRGEIDREVMGTKGILCTTCAPHTICVFVPDVSLDLGLDMDRIPGFIEFLGK